MLNYTEEFLEVAEPIINHTEYQRMKNIRHHDESVYEHCLNTAVIAYRISKKLNLDYVSIIRGSLLHDFFLYKFKRGKGLKIVTAPFKHAKNHPVHALNNARNHFVLNNKEQDIIKNHMFPFGFPKSKESWIVTLVDKTIAIVEYSKRFKNYSKRKCKLLFEEMA